MIRITLITVFLTMLTAGAAAAESGLHISDGWIRAVPPVSPAMAAYFTLTNQGEQAVTLTGAKASFAGKVMLHASGKNSDGEATMSGLHEVVVKPGESLTFRPGVRHVMLMKLSSVPKAGDTVRLCLAFLHHDDVCAPFQVRHDAP